MAIWYTNYLTGNDTTGAGTIANPYKTIAKAMTVGANNDTINVAGSSFTNLPGTLTVTKGSANITTSQSLVGIVNPGDVINLVDPDWGSGAILLKVFSVSATTLVVNMNLYIQTGTVLTGSKLNTVHYYTTTASTVFEPLGTTTFNNKIGFNIQGGWTNNFTQQDGITAFVYHGASATASSGTSIGIGAAGCSEWTLNNFAFFNMTAWDRITGFSSPASTYYGNLWFSLSRPNIANPKPKDGLVSNWYHLQSTYGNIGVGDTTGTNACGLQLDKMYIMNSGSVISGSGTGVPFKINNLYCRSVQTGAGPTSNGALPGTFNVINSLNICFTQSTGIEAFTITESNNQKNIIRDIVFSGVNSNSTKNLYAKYGGTNNQTSFILDTKNINDFPFVSYYSPSTSNNFSNTYTQPIYVKDTEGTKTILQNGAIVYADPTVYDTGTNSYRITRSANNGSSQVQLVPVKDFLMPSPATAKTITIRAKAEVAGNYIFGLSEPANYYTTNITNPIAQQTFALTTSWNDYIFTGLQDANIYALYENSRVYFTVGNNSNWAGANIWIDSVTIS